MSTVVIAEAPTEQLLAMREQLVEQSSFGNSKQLAMALRIKIKAIDLTLAEREEV